MSPGSKDGLALLTLIAWGIGCLLARPVKTVRLVRGHGWYDR